MPSKSRAKPPSPFEGFNSSPQVGPTQGDPPRRLARPERVRPAGNRAESLRTIPTREDQQRPAMTLSKGPSPLSATSLIGKPTRRAALRHWRCGR